MQDKPLQAHMTREAPQPTPTWGLVLINGIAAVGFSLLFLASPGTTTRILMRFLGLFFLIGGLSSLFSIVINSEHWGWKLIAGLAGIIGGMIVMEHPMWSALLADTTLVMALAGFGIVMGVAYVIQAFRGGGWGTGFLGVVFFIFGLILLISPLISAAILPYLLAAFGIIGGIIAIYIAFRMRRGDKERGL